VHACLRRRATAFEVALEVSMEDETQTSAVVDVLTDGAPGGSCNNATPGSGVTSVWTLGESVIAGWNAQAQALYVADRHAESHALLLKRWDAIEHFGSPEQRAQARFLRGAAELTSKVGSDGFNHLIEAHALATASGADELVASTAVAILAWAPEAGPTELDTWTRRAQVDVERTGNPRLIARFYVAVGSRENSSGHFDRAAEAAKTAEAILEGRESYADVAWSVASLRGDIEQGRRDYDVALVHFETALDLLEKWRGPGSMLSLHPRAGLIQALLGTGDFESAAGVLEEQDTILDKLGHGSTNHGATISLLRASYFEATGDLASATLAARAQAELLLPTDRNWSDVHTRLGLALLRSSDYVAARDVFERIRVQQEAQLGSSSQRLAITLHNLAEAEAGMGELDRAAEHYQEALSITEQRKAESPAQAYILTGLGEVELWRGNLDLARAHLTRALTISHDDEAERGETRFSLARTLWKLGTPEFRAHALQLADQAAAALDETPGYEQTALELSRWRETL
jgi:tetratricopeptide (TPR) repeat protein